MTTFFLFLAQMEESIAEMTTFRQIKAEKAICSDWVSAALQGVPLARLSMHSKCLDFFSFEFWVGGGEDFLIFHLFPTCSLQVPNGFPSGSQHFPSVPNVFLKCVPNSTSL
jgi:hypothetical protein